MRVGACVVGDIATTEVTDAALEAFELVLEIAVLCVLQLILLALPTLAAEAEADSGGAEKAE